MFIKSTLLLFAFFSFFWGRGQGQSNSDQEELDLTLFKNDYVVNESSPEVLLWNDLLFYYDSVINLSLNVVSSMDELPESWYTGSSKYYVTSGIYETKAWNLETMKRIEGLGTPHPDNLMNSFFTNEPFVIFPTRKYLRRVDLSSGAILWEKRFERNIKFSFEFDHGYLVCLENKENFGSNKMLFLDKRNASLIWEQDIKGELAFEKKHYSDDHFFCFRLSGYSDNNESIFRILCFDLTTGQIIYKTVGESFFRDGSEIFVSNKGSITRLDIKSGKELDTFDVLGKAIGKVGEDLIVSYADVLIKVNLSTHTLNSWSLLDSVLSPEESFSEDYDNEGPGDGFAPLDAKVIEYGQYVLLFIGEEGLFLTKK